MKKLNEIYEEMSNCMVDLKVLSLLTCIQSDVILYQDTKDEELLTEAREKLLKCSKLIGGKK